MFWRAAVVDGVWPLDISILNMPNIYYNHRSLGTITLVAGGGVGLAGSMLVNRDK